MAKQKMAAATATLLIVLFLCHHAASASAGTVNNPLGDLFAKANDTASSSAAAAAAPPPAPSTGLDDKMNEDNKEAREKKELEEIEKMKEEAKKDQLTSFTNGTGSYKGMSGEFINGHNEVRERYGVPAMEWNNKLARHARRWSNAMRKDCQLKHSATNNYGESIFTSPKSTGWNATAKDALDSWSSEETIYDRQTGNCTAGHQYAECGHFINMVSEKNQKIGCGRAECYSGGVFITCNYYLRDHDP